MAIEKRKTKKKEEKKNAFGAGNSSRGNARWRTRCLRRVKVRPGDKTGTRIHDTAPDGNTSYKNSLLTYPVRGNTPPSTTATNDNKKVRGHTSENATHPSNPLSHRRLLGDDKRLRLPGVGHVGPPAELYRRGSPLLTTRVCRLGGSFRSIGRLVS